MDAADYQYTINQSGVITIPVFDQQSICFNNGKLPVVLDWMAYNTVPEAAPSC
ncbi:hypothetical protein NXY40_03225 [Phocaeicola vulgatus]|nr:hypothetical protein [Phocaeicola vulgatus]